MISPQEALDHLFSDANFHFRDFLEEISLCDAKESPQVLLIVNTIELFAFGNVTHYYKYRDSYVELPREGLRKLVLLTLISVCNDNEGLNVPIQTLMSLLEPALGRISEITAEQALERILIHMNDQRLIQARIDQRNGCVEFMGSTIQRDAFNRDTYKLRVLDEQEDISNRSVTRARSILERWVNDYVAPASRELQQPN